MPVAFDTQSSTATNPESESTRVKAGVVSLKAKYGGLRARGFEMVKKQVKKEYGVCVQKYPAMIERQHVEMNDLCTIITEDVRSIDSEIKDILKEAQQIVEVAKKEEIKVTEKMMKEFTMFELDKSKGMAKFKEDLKKERNTPVQLSNGKIGKQWAMVDEITEDLSTTDTGSVDEH